MFGARVNRSLNYTCAGLEVYFRPNEEVFKDDKATRLDQELFRQEPPALDGRRVAAQLLEVGELSARAVGKTMSLRKEWFRFFSACNGPGIARSAAAASSCSFRRQ